jgi:hypothetical protein
MQDFISKAITAKSLKSALLGFQSYLFLEQVADSLPSMGCRLVEPELCVVTLKCPRLCRPFLHK